VEVPSHLSPYEINHGYLFMDHGEIHNGLIVTFDEFKDRAFVVERQNTQKLLALKEPGANPSLKDITALAWEIWDFDKVLDQFLGSQDIGNRDPNPDMTRYGQHEWNKMFVFGAGASANSVFDSDSAAFRESTFCPPIGNQLFGKKFQSYIKKFPGVERSLASLKRYGNQVEAFFEGEWDGIVKRYSPEIISRHISIAFYLKELFNKISEETIENYFDCSIYAAFCDHIQKSLKNRPNEKVAFVSFNYDTLLDHSVSQFFDQSFNEMEDYVRFNEKPFMLFKPHGSCNWGWKFKEEFLNENIADIPKYLFENNVSFAQVYFNLLGNIDHTVWHNSWGYIKSTSQRRSYSINKNIIKVIHSDPEDYFPALLIPYQNKDEFVMPYYHRDTMKEFIRRMEDLYLIGWKGNEAAFNDLLKRADHLKRIVIVNPYPEEVKKNLLEHELDLTKYDVIHDDRTVDFETFLKSDLI